MIFLYEFKLGYKTVQATCNVNSAFCQKTATNLVSNIGVENFGIEIRALKTIKVADVY